MRGNPPSGLELHIDARESMARVAAQFARMPAKVDLARKRAMRKLTTWMQRQALKALARDTGIPQNWWPTKKRFFTRWDKDEAAIWIGTNAIPLHRLALPVWYPGKKDGPTLVRNRQMRSFKQLGPDVGAAWSWGPGSKTGIAVMERSGSGRLPLRRIDVSIDQSVTEALAAIGDEALKRLEKLLVEELNYALNVEPGR